MIGFLAYITQMKRHERLLMALAKREKVERSEKRRRLQLERQRQELQRRMQRVETVQEVKVGCFA